MFGLFSDADNDAEKFEYDEEVTMSMLLQCTVCSVILVSTTELNTWLLFLSILGRILHQPLFDQT